MEFNEYERAMEIDEKQKFSMNVMKDGILLCRYYKTNGLSKEEARNKISSIVQGVGYNLSDLFKQRCINDIMSLWDKLLLIKNDPVFFYKEEMDIIQKIEDKTQRKVLFALLYIKKNSGERFFEATSSDISRICIKRFRPSTLNDALYNLRIAGYVEFSNYKGRNKTEIVFPALNIQYTSEPVITITNKHNIINYYLNYINEDRFVFCKNCGKLVLAKSNNNPYCDKCAKESLLKSYREATKKYKNKNRS